MQAITAHRRNLHRIPEIGFSLPKTRAYVLEALRNTGARIEIVAESGVLAYFDAGRSGAIAFRADMDALPIQEQTGAEFASLHEDNMHACGHDGHMAILLALAEYIAARKDRLRHNVLLVFQPAEESGGGGEVITNSNALERYGVRRIFALHVDPDLPIGALASRPGPLMAHTSEVHVEVRGRAAHVAQASEGADALAAGAEFVTRALEMERAMPEGVRRLLKFGAFHAGTAVNVLADDAKISGTLRSFEADAHAYMKAQMAEIAAACEAAHGVSIEVDVYEGYPVLVNDPALYSEVKATLRGMNFVELDSPSLLGEDFAYYLQRVPGVMLKLGIGTGVALHAPRFYLDEAALLYGFEAFVKLLGID